MNMELMLAVITIRDIYIKMLKNILKIRTYGKFFMNKTAQDIFRLFMGYPCFSNKYSPNGVLGNFNARYCA